jgi:phosphatidylglycerol lysyltransferase
VRALVLRHGWNATAYQIVNPGIRHWFSARGDAVIGFARRNGVRVVAGGPVCAGARLAAVVAEWEADAARAGDRVWVWKPSQWAERNTGSASLRAQLNRARNKGVVVSEWPPAVATDHPELRRCLEEWLATRGLPPLHFLVEPRTLSYLEDRRIFVAERAGSVVGFVVASPVPARNGWLTEQFVRGQDAPNGTIELLLDATARAVAASRSGYLTMGLVPLAEHAGLPLHDNPAWLRLVLAWVRAHGRRFYNFRGLEAFKAKFQPCRWEPIFAISNEPHFTPRTLYAIAAAFTDSSPLWAVARGLGRALRQEIRWLFE